MGLISKLANKSLGIKAKPFNNRFKIDENDDGKYAILNANGSPISDYYDEIDYFTDDLAKVYEGDKELFALMNAEGQLVTEWYDSIEEFVDKIYKLSKDDDEQIYNVCTHAISNKYYNIEEYNDSYFEVTNRENHDLIALINHEGHLVTDWVKDEDNFIINESLDFEFSHPKDIEEKNSTINNNINSQNITKMGLFDQIKNAGSTFLNGGQQPQQNAAQQRPAQQSDAQPVNNQSSTSGLYNPQLEKLIDIALADGELSEKEKQVLFKKAESMGIDLDEFEMVLDARLYEQSQKAQAASQGHAAPQSNKFGDIKKCPACGAMIQSFTTKCPDCGYEFRNVEANCSIQRLFEMLNDVEREDKKGFLDGLSDRLLGTIHDYSKKKAIVQNFPIPNTKDDIIEFLTLALPLAKKPGFFDHDMEKEEMYPVWKAKCEQIILKARFSMKDDPKTLAEINEYGKQIGIK